MSLFAWLISGVTARAQTSPLRNDPPPAAAEPANVGLTDFFSQRTPYEFWLTALIVCFGVIVIAAILWFFRGTANENGDRVVRSLIVVVIVVGTLVLITAGYSNEQVAPAFGLFGTIVGYILGRLSTAHEPTPGAQARPSGKPSKGPAS